MAISNDAVETVLNELQKFINARPKLDRANYGCHIEQLRYSSQQERQQAWSALRGDLRSIAKDGTRARKALKEARNYPPNGVALADAFRAFSGRLTWNGTELEYCTGQYYPMEYRAAAAAVLESYNHAVRPKFTPDAGIFYTHISQIEYANQWAGFHFFDASSMRFFRSRALPSVFHGPGGVYFVTSEKAPHSERAFTIRKFDPATADIDTFGPFNTLGRERALRLARIAAENPDAALEALKS